MTWYLSQPSFWPEHRDPWAWQRCLRVLVEHTPLPAPRPCWEKWLKDMIPRRSIPGLYGLRKHPTPASILGAGFLVATDDGWIVEETAIPLLEANRPAFQEELARWLIRRSAWLRLVLHGLSQGTWSFPRGVGVLQSNSHLRIGKDLRYPTGALQTLLSPEILLGEMYAETIQSIETTVPFVTLSALHGPLSLLHALGWLDQAGQLHLPDDIATTLSTVSPALLLRNMTQEESDSRGFVVFSRIAGRLWSAWYGTKPNGSLGSWADQVFNQAIQQGSIEVEAWEAGQPRHGRGFLGDLTQKRVRWVVHDDFKITIPEEHPQTGRKS